jgi:hypothetical protein
LWAEIMTLTKRRRRRCDRAGTKSILASGACAAWLAVCTSGASAQSFSINGYGDLRAVVPSDERSAFDGGLGKLRFDTGARFGPNAHAEAVAVGKAVLDPQFDATATVRAAPDQRTPVDVLEAYGRYRPVATRDWRWTVKAGAFYPPISLENESVGWSSPWTLTPSAINSWVGDELRTIGGETEVEWRYATGRLAGTLAVYGWNDPAGVLIAERGWALNDRPVGLFDELRLPDAIARARRKRPPLHEDAFREIDDTPGWYAGLTWRQDGLGKIAVLYYDNEADPAAARGGQVAWRTRFGSVGIETYVGEVVLLAQALAGTTRFDPSPTFHSITDFQSAYLLAGYYFGDFRIAARFDVFATQETHPGSSPDLGEHGGALTLSASWNPVRIVRISAEVIGVDSVRQQRTSQGLPARADEVQFQLATRVFF